MPAAVIAGKGGAVYVTGSPDTRVALLTEFTITINRDNYDGSVMGDEWKSSVVGTAAWSVSCNGYFDVEDDPGQTLVQNAVFLGTALTMEFHIDNGASKYVGLVNLTSVEVGNPAEGIVTFNASGQGNGQLFFS